MTGTAKTTAQLTTDADAVYADSQATAAITPARVRQHNEDIIATMDARAQAGIGGFLPGVVNNGDYTVIGYVPGPGTLTAVWCKTSGGTLTANFKKNGVSITGNSAIAVTTTGTLTNATAGNTLVTGDRIIVTITAVSSALDFEFAYKFART